MPATLSFLQEFIDEVSFSTIKVYQQLLATPCNKGFGDKKVSQHPLVSVYEGCSQALLPVSRPLMPPWDLAVDLEGLKGLPFEPLVSNNCLLRQYSYWLLPRQYLCALKKPCMCSFTSGNRHMVLPFVQQRVGVSSDFFQFYLLDVSGLCMASAVFEFLVDPRDPPHWPVLV